MTAQSTPLIRYTPEIENEIEQLAATISADPTLAETYPARWLAIQLLEGDHSLLKNSQTVQAALQASLERLEAIYGEELEITIADHRYNFIQKIVAATVTQSAQQDRSLSDRIDSLMTHRWLGVPVFLFIMYLVFNLVQNVSAPYLDWIDGIFSGPLTNWSLALLAAVNAPSWLASLVVEGVLAGVGGVLVFVPGLFIMYVSLAILEQSGYLARAAFVMDRFMSKAGLHGKSFIPMILGFGCNVPAIYATRTIKKREARILTALLIPFMSCSARLPVYIIFGLAFFPQHANLVIFSLYLLGIVVAAVVGLLLSRLLFKGETLSILMMELPSYRMPTTRAVLRHAWRQSKEFIRNAGTVIVAFSTILWLLLNLPWGVTEARHSYFGQVSAAIAPVLAPAGFGDWEASGALVTGLVAKEIVVSTLAQVYHLPQEETVIETTAWEDVQGIVVGFFEATLSAGQELLEVLTPGIALFPEDDTSEDIALSQALRGVYSPLSAYAFLVFVLLYVPCVATIGAQKQEFGWQWMSISIAITLIVPWVLSVLVYQGGLLLGFS